jgi:uncharacterized membrane protein YgcG
MKQYRSALLAAAAVLGLLLPGVPASAIEPDQAQQIAAAVKADDQAGLAAAIQTAMAAELAAGISPEAIFQDIAATLFAQPADAATTEIMTLAFVRAAVGSASSFPDADLATLVSGTLTAALVAAQGDKAMIEGVLTAAKQAREGAIAGLDAATVDTAILAAVQSPNISAQNGIQIAAAYTLLDGLPSLPNVASSQAVGSSGSGRPRSTSDLFPGGLSSGGGSSGGGAGGRPVSPN